MRKIALMAILAVFTAACSTAYRSDVTRFHKLPEPQGETIFITSSDAAKAGSLEFSQYAGLLVPQLRSLGYEVVTDPKADLVLEIDYDVTQSERRYSVAGGYPYHHYPYFSPYRYGIGYGGFQNVGIAFRAHMSSLTILVERGLVGLLLAYWIIVALPAAFIIRYLGNVGNPRENLIGLMVSSQIFFANIFYEMYDKPMMWILVGLLAGMAWPSRVIAQSRLQPAST